MSCLIESCYLCVGLCGLQNMILEWFCKLTAVVQFGFGFKKLNHVTSVRFSYVALKYVS